MEQDLLKLSSTNNRMEKVFARIGFIFGILTTALVQAQTPKREIWKWPTRFDGPCEYHPIPSGATAMTTTVIGEGQNLKPDGMGRYWHGNDTVRSYLGYEGRAYNFYTYWPETCEEPLPHKWRFLEFDLNSPEGGAKPRGIIRDYTAMIHIFPQGFRFTGDPDSTAIKDIGVGKTVSAQRVLLRFHHEGKIYFLRMGSDTFDPAFPAQVELLSGVGTSMAKIVRETETTWTISAARDSLARLSIWGAEPVDLGLYHFSFEIRIETKPTKLR